MGRVNVLCDQLFVKAPGTTVVTPWHRDGPYWPVRGAQIVSIWIALDDVTAASSGVEYLRGSHRRGRAFGPVSFGGDAAMDAMLPGETLLDIEAMRAELDVASFQEAAGDCLQLHAMTVHGAPGNAHASRRRRAHATRWCGDAVVWAPRAGQAAITIEPPTLAAGEPLGGALFPRRWPR